MNSWNTLDDVRDYLIPKGFHEYTPPDFRRYEGLATIFQKRYEDDIGKKYFIDAKIWDWTWTDKIPERFHIEYECQLYQKGTHDAFNVEFIDWTLEQVVDYIEKMFENGMLDYYETWEGDRGES